MALLKAANKHEYDVRVAALKEWIKAELAQMRTEFSSSRPHRWPDVGAPPALTDGPVADHPHPVTPEVGVMLPKSDRLDGDAVDGDAS